MKPARLIILAVAVVAAGMAGLLAMRLSGNKTVIVQDSVVQKEPTIDVLVSAKNLPVGARLDESAMRWMPWPEGSVVDGFITSSTRPDALTELNGVVVRLPMFEGEPLRREKSPIPLHASCPLSCPPENGPSRPKSRWRRVPVVSSCPMTAWM